MSPSAHPSVCVLHIKDIGHTGFGSSLKASFYLSYLFKVSNGHILRSQALDFKIQIWKKGVKTVEINNREILLKLVNWIRNKHSSRNAHATVNYGHAQAAEDSKDFKGNV